jgi:hypothetical protein
MTGLVGALERAGGDPEYGQLVTAAADRIAELEYALLEAEAALHNVASVLEQQSKLLAAAKLAAYKVRDK